MKLSILLNRAFIFVLISLSAFSICGEVLAKPKQLQVPQIAPPRVFDYTPRKPSFSLPQYHYPCRQILLHFPTGEEFARTAEAKKDLFAELDFIYSNGDYVANKLPEIYNRLVDSIVSELEVAPKNQIEIPIILNFEKALPSVEECGRALGSWESNAPKIESAFGNYYSESQNEFKVKFQALAQSRLSRSSLLFNEAYLNDFKRSNFISSDLSNSLSLDIEAANNRLAAARSQFEGTYFAQNLPIDKSQCVIEDADIKLRGRINTDSLYPRAALSKSIEGEVVVRLNIDSNGKASGVEFASVSHEDLRSEAILNAFRNASFWPQIKDCAPVAATGNQKLNFRMGY